MTAKNKLRKLIRDPNRYFFDYFAKRIGASETRDSASGQFLVPPGYEFRSDTHPWVQIAKKFGLRTGATTGHPDQSLLVNSTNLLDFLTYTLWIARGLNSDIRIYTLGGAFKTTIKGADALSIKKSEWVYSKLSTRSDFVIEYVGEFSNNFAAHIFLFDVDATDLHVVRSNLAFVKKTRSDAFKSIYPDIIDQFGEYAFGVPEPVDLVFTWVNKDDPKWIKLWNESFPEKQFDPDRYSSRDELKYALRAVEKFLPWSHRIFIVSNCDKPDWIQSSTRIKWIEHERIFPDTSALPTFNSHAIEACLHLIPELSEKFIYFNDDMLVSRPCYYHDFFDAQGRTVAQLEPYGMVFECNLFDSTRDYLAPAIKSQRLIATSIPGVKATRLHKHTPYALSRTVLEEIEQKFQKDIDQTRRSRLRTAEDVNLTSFLFHHYALACGRAVIGDAPYVIIKPQNAAKHIAAGVTNYKFICFNDGDGSANDAAFSSAFAKLVTEAFPCRSSLETAAASFAKIKLSVTIMAYKDRAHRISYLRSRLGPADVSLDDGRYGLLENSKRSWLKHDPDADFHLVIQDDAVICSDFHRRVENVLVKFPGSSTGKAYCLYFREKNPNQKVFVEFNERANAGIDSGYFVDKYLRFGIAAMIPTTKIKAMIKHAGSLEHLGNHDDTRYSHFLSRKRIPVVYPLPSLIDQAPDLVSTHTKRSNADLTATWFADGENGFLADRSDRSETQPSAPPKSSELKELSDKGPPINLYWWDSTPNFGDEIGPWLVKRITGREIQNIKGTIDQAGLMSVGSILQQVDRAGMTVWGSGIVRRYGADASRKLSNHAPKKLTAVRGKLTFDYVTKKLGWNADPVFGDPALLMPNYFDPTTHSTGTAICPHYQHAAVFEKFASEFNIINVKSGVEPVVREIAGASACLSTSLHGLIIAQAYEVPWVWLRIKDSPLKGGDFKFEDFFSVLERDEISIVDISLAELDSFDPRAVATKARVPRKRYDLKALLDAFPQEL